MMLLMISIIAQIDIMARHAGLLLLCALVLVCVRADDWDDWDDWEPTRPSSNTPASASQTNPAPASAPKPESKSSTPSDDDWSDWGDWGDETASAPKQPPPSPPPPTKPPAAQSTDNDDWDDWGDEPAEPKQQPPAPAQHSQSAGASNDNWDDWGEEEQAAPPPAPKQPPPSPSPRSSDTWDDWDDWGEDAAAPPSPPPTPAPSQKQTTSNSEGKHDDWDDWGDGDATAGSSGPSDAAARASTNEDDIDDDEGNEPMTFDVQGPGGQVFTLSIRPRDHLDTAVSAFCTKHGLSNFEQLVNHVRPHYEARAKDIGPTRGEKREQEDPEFWNPNIQFNFWMPPRNLQVRYRRDEDFEQRAQAFVTEHRLGNHMVIWTCHVMYDTQCGAQSNMLEVRNRTREYQEGFVAWMQESYRMYEGIPARAKPGAKKYFLDLGSRTAEFYKQLHNFWFFEGFEFFLFECNPRMSATVRHAVKDDPHATFLEKAEDGTMKFWIDNDPQQADHGSSLFEDHAMVEGEELMSEVETVDFSKWLGELATVDDLVVVRMDIEGAEYEVLKKLIVDGNAKLIDHLDLEYHAAFAPSLRKHLPADKVLPWILEGYGTTVKTGDYYSEIQCEKNADGEELSKLKQCILIESTAHSAPLALT